MAKEVIMPALGMAQESGTLLEWLIDEGAEVHKGEPLMTVATDKTDVEIEAPASGVLANVRVAPGDEVPVGQTIALIVAPGESVADVTETATAPTQTRKRVQTEALQPAASSSVAASPVAARMAAEHDIELASIRPAGDRIQKEDVLAAIQDRRGAPSTQLRVPASPKARRLAAEHDLDLAGINGSGPENAVLAADVLDAVKAAQEAADQAASEPIPEGEPGAVTHLPVSRMWRVMAQRLSQSWQEAPHFYLERDVEASGLVAWRERVQARVEAKITYTDLLVKLVAAALRQHPRLNAAWYDGEIAHNADVNIGLAVAVEEGLIVPVIHSADRLGVGALAERRADRVARALDGTLTPDELSGGTFTVSNLGMYGVDRFNAIVNPPQAAILAVGRLADRIVPVEGQPAVRPMLTLTLSCDHRVVDGARGAKFLQTLAESVADPLAVLD